ncbi:MAG: hypothetical protein RBT47_04050 [Anaerolineae bacterium]|nr:hypothetical protein [Anaerolineae bacterium]
MTQGPVYHPEYTPESLPPMETEVLPPMDYGSPVPPKKDNKTLIIILVVVALLILCCCCSITGWYLWENGDQIIEELSMLPLFLA